MHITIMRGIAILLLGLLLDLAPLVLGKGGGKSSSSSGKSSNKGSSSSSTGSTSYKSGSVTVVHSGTTYICYNSSGDIVNCPKNTPAAIIAGAVIGGIVGLIVLGYLTYWIVMCIRDKRGQREKKKIVLPSLSFGKQEYKPLADEEEHV